MSSVPQITIPAGQTAEVGVCMAPVSGLPAPGTNVSFNVVVTSKTDPSVSTTAAETFAVPALDVITLASNPAIVSTTPGTSANATIMLTNVGNVTENDIMVTATSTTGLTITTPAPVSLMPGESTTATITLTPAASTPLNSFFQGVITATYGPAGSLLTQTLTLPVQVVVPGAAALIAAASAAQGLNGGVLVAPLNDLVTHLDNLVEDPTNAVDLAEVETAIATIVSQLVHDPFLASYAPSLTAASSALAAAPTGFAVQAAINTLGTALNSLAGAITDEVQSGFTLSLSPDRALAQPQGATVFDLDIHNIGSATATYDLSVSGLPAGVAATLSHPSVTVASHAFSGPGNNSVTVSLTETSTTLIPASFTVTATARGAGEITLSTPGALTLPVESLLVGSVLTNPNTTTAGGSVDVTVNVQSVVDQPRTVDVGYSVANSAGQVVFTSTPVPQALATTSSTTAVDLGSFDTTGFANGVYTITATITDQSASPLAPASGQVTYIVGLPVGGTLTVSSPTLITGDNVVTDTLQVNALSLLPSPLTLLGGVSTPAPGTSVALDGHYAYESSTDGIDIIDVSDPAHPQLVSTFGGNDISNGQFGFNVVQVANGDLYIATDVDFLKGVTSSNQVFNLVVYALTDPTNPQLVSNTQFDYYSAAGLVVNSTGTTAFVPTNGNYFGSFFNPDIFDQFGSFLSFDLSQPATPTLQEALFNDRGAPTVATPIRTTPCWSTTSSLMLRARRRRVATPATGPGSSKSSTSPTRRRWRSTSR